MNAPGSRKTKADIERHSFERFRAACPLPTGALSYGDKPDVILTGERKTGIEITNFFLQSGTLPESEQRQKPLRADVVSKAHALYRAGGGTGIELTFAFDACHPITPARKRLLPAELAELAKQHGSRPSGPLERSLLQATPEIAFAYLNAREYSDAKSLSEYLRRE